MRAENFKDVAKRRGMGTDMDIEGISKGENHQEGKRQAGISRPLGKRLYSLAEAAHYLGRTIWSMRELIWAGRLPIVRDGKRIFVDIHDLNAYIEKNKTTYL